MEETSWLILTALGLEYAAVKEQLSNCSSVVHPRGSRYEVGSLGGMTVALAECGAGNTGAALESERAIAFFNPRAVLFVGIAGGVKDVQVGDVVFSSKIYGYESGKAEKTFRPRPQAFVPSYALLQEAKEIARNPVEGAQVFVGPIAAGEKVVASVESPEFAFIKQQYGDVLAVEMEGYGFLHAGYVNNAECMVIRGISDLIDGKTESDAAGSQPLAARNAAQCASALIKLHQKAAAASIPDQRTLTEIAERLYPTGPNENQLWARAGGNVALLSIGQSGRASWFSAIKTLYLGGGGAITIQTLIKTMREDHVNNLDLNKLI